MRINKFLAQATGISRRTADKYIEWGRVKVNGQNIQSGYDVKENDKVTLDDTIINPLTEKLTIIFNKPTDYVVSRNGQGSKTIYELLPEKLHHLKAIGRLDKASSGLLLLTNDGELAQKLTHPSYHKPKIYQIELYIPLKLIDKQMIENGIQLEDGLSKFKISGKDKNWEVTMTEGRNRQIRRTFSKLGYTISKLHRISFGDANLGDIAPAKWEDYSPNVQEIAR